jgi:hypothetical protein
MISSKSDDIACQLLLGCFRLLYLPDLFWLNRNTAPRVQITGHKKLSVEIKTTCTDKDDSIFLCFKDNNINYWSAGAGGDERLKKFTKVRHQFKSNKCNSSPHLVLIMTNMIIRLASSVCMHQTNNIRLILKTFCRRVINSNKIHQANGITLTYNDKKKSY